jgi:subtilisin family serine protease
MRRVSSILSTRKLWQLTIVFVTAALLVATGSANRVTANASTASRFPTFDMMMQKAKSAPIRLLVTLNIPFQSEGQLGRNATTSQRNAIQTASSNLIADLAKSGGNYQLIAAYKTVPVVALEADSTALIHLANSADVKHIQEDIPVPPTDLSSNNVIGLPAAFTAGWEGTGWAVAILDTGVQTSHPFFTGRTVSELCFSTTDAGQGSQTLCPNGQSTNNGQPAQTGTGAAADCTNAAGCGHGTHVAGTALGKNYVGGPGYDGVARNGNVIAVQVFSLFTGGSCGGGGSPCVLSYSSDQLAALEYIYNTLRPQMSIASINMSLGGGQFFATCDNNSLKPIIDNLRSEKIATVIAAGNSGFTSSLGAPACISSAISIGATQDDDAVATFSNRANFMTMYAPGVDIDSSEPGSTFGNKSGTSMAAPHVAGAWAVMRHKYPTWTVDQVLNQILTTGVSITDSGFTKPRLKLDAAVGGGLPTPTPTNTPPPNRPDTIGVYLPNGTWYLRNSNSTGGADITASFGGDANDLPVVGDWNGDGMDTIGVYRNSTGFFILSNSNTAPAVNYEVLLGNPGDTPFAGRWRPDLMTGDGIGVFRPSNGILYQKRQLTSGFSDYFAVFGNPGDTGFAGDWNNDMKDSIGVYRPGNTTWYGTNNSEPSGITFGDFGFVWDIGIDGIPFVGDWDGDAVSTVGYLRTTDGTFVLHATLATAGADNSFAFGPAGARPVAGKWTLPSRPPMNRVVIPIQAPVNSETGGLD